MRPAFALLAAALAAPALARAGEARCWYDAGVLVVPAEVMGVAGDYVLDTATPATLLADTPAQAAGFAETALKGEVRLAGLVLEDRPVTVATLDARFRNLPTPVAGMIGADILAAYVLDVRFRPCRVGLWRPDEAPRFRAGRVRRLALAWSGGRPVTAAAVADSAGRTLSGDFVLATGSDTPVRLRDDRATAPGAPKPASLYPYGGVAASLRALSFAGDLYENLPAGLLPKAEQQALGEIGAPLLAHYRLRFDFPALRLDLAPAAGGARAKQKGPPDRSGGP